MTEELVQISAHKKKVDRNKVDRNKADRKKADDSPTRLVLTLTFAGLLSGLAIVSAYELTRPRILANQARALRQAVFEVVPGAERLQRLAWRQGELVLAAGDTGDEPSIYAGYGADRRFLGYAIPCDGPGYQDTIALIYGFEPRRRRVIGMWVLESRETPGLGDRIYKDADFVGAFRDLAVDPRIELVKGGAAADHQVDAITGATISSRAVVRIVSEAHDRWLSRLPEPGSEPTLGEVEQ